MHTSRILARRLTFDDRRHSCALREQAALVYGKRLRQPHGRASSAGSDPSDAATAACFNLCRHG
jgi:hypothetical protein